MLVSSTFSCLKKGPHRLPSRETDLYPARLSFVDKWKGKYAIPRGCHVELIMKTLSAKFLHLITLFLLLWSTPVPVPEDVCSVAHFT